MNLLAACHVFVHVGERGSVTRGAAAARVPQSVASRRIAALEKHFGAPLLDRTTRRAVLTDFGRDMLPSAKRLVQLAEALEDDAERARIRPFGLAVPVTCSLRHLALLDAAAHRAGTVLDVRPAGPAERAELLRTRSVRAALVAVPADDAEWTVPLGVASARRPRRATPFRLDTLRPVRAERSFRRVRLQPEDDVPHVRDRLTELGHRAALLPAQIAVSTSLVAAASEVLGGDDLLLCSASQAGELRLAWRPLAGAGVARGYRLAATVTADADQVRDRLRDQVALALGAVPEDEEGSEGENGK